jgi:hypothetical protein
MVCLPQPNNVQAQHGGLSSSQSEKGRVVRNWATDNNEPIQGRKSAHAKMRGMQSGISKHGHVVHVHLTRSLSRPFNSSCVAPMRSASALSPFFSRSAHFARRLRLVGVPHVEAPHERVGLAAKN